MFPAKVTVRMLPAAKNFSRRQTPTVAGNFLRNDKSNTFESNYVFKKLQMGDLDFTAAKSPTATDTKDGSASESLLSMEIRITALICLCYCVIWLRREV